MGLVVLLLLNCRPQHPIPPFYTARIGAGNMNVDKQDWGHLTISERSNYQPSDYAELNGLANKKFQYDLLYRSTWIVGRDVNTRIQVYKIRPWGTGDTMLTKEMFAIPKTSNPDEIKFVGSNLPEIQFTRDWK